MVHGARDWVWCCLWMLIRFRFSPPVQESTQNLLRLVHDAAFETALKGQFDEDRETVETILRSALSILEGKPAPAEAA